MNPSPIRQPFVWLALATLALVACSSDPTPARSPGPTATLESPATPEPVATRESLAPVPTAAPIPFPAPPTTPGPAATQETVTQSLWVSDRIWALELLYTFTPVGQQWLEGYDLRQMIGQPGWFGSFGNQSWAGVGQAIPDRVLHELSHSYYGAFPVTGRPQLTWDILQGDDLSSALRQYREDLVTFMAQPPDRYEPLRDRFRNLPNLSNGQYPDLFHFGEADLISMVGSNLNLVPPILRKYFDQFLQPGEHKTWDQALRWYLGLSEQDKRVANGYFGLVHFPLPTYRGMRPQSDARVSAPVPEVLAGEERQRLRDFAHQYDLIKSEKFGLVDAASVDRDFKFWRGLLRDMLELHSKHPRVLKREIGEQGVRLADVMDTFLEAKNLPQEEQVELFKPRLDETLIADFVVLLNSRVLVELFRESAPQAGGESAQEVIGKFTEKLKRFISAVNTTITIGKSDLPGGVAAFQDFLEELSDQELQSNLALVFDLLWEADRDTAERLVNSMSEEAILRIFDKNPAATMNGRVRPERLLAVLKITEEASQRQFTEGMQALLDNSSGNFQIDASFTTLAFRRIANRSRGAPQEALEVLKAANIPLSALPYNGFLVDEPEAASAILAADLNEAAELIANREGYGETPQRVIHTLIVNDPALAGRIVATLSAQGEEETAREALIVFAYDAERLDANPDVNLSLEKDKRFLNVLIDAEGQEWVRQRMEEVIRKYEGYIRQGIMDANFLKAYPQTLRQIVSLEQDAKRRAVLEETFSAAFLSATGQSLAES